MYVRTLLIMFVIIWESCSAGIYLFILCTYVLRIYDLWLGLLTAFVKILCTYVGTYPFCQVKTINQGQ